MSDSSADLREVGRIVRSHGVCGQVKVAPETDDPDRVASLKRVYVGAASNDVTPFDLESFKTQTTKHGQTMILELSGVRSREEADALRTLSVFAATGDLPPLDENEYFLGDLIGYSVINDSGAVLGIVSDVLELPAHSTLSIELKDGTERLVPLVDEFVLDIDRENEQLTLNLIEGLL
jgi:16S rRNA processing protein RimM